MANIEKKVGNGIQVKFDKNIKLSGKDIARGGRKLVKELTTTTVRVKQTIPISLLNEVGKSIAAGFPAGVGGTKFRQIRKITAPIRRIQHLYYAYYTAGLMAMDHKLKAPGIRATKLRVRQQVVIPLALKASPDFGLLSDTVTVPVDWRGLSRPTMSYKRHLKNRTFWRHTTEGSQAFSALVKAKLSRTSPRSFMITDRKPPTVVSGSKNIRGAGKFLARAQYSFKLGIPTWTRKMDALVTLPMATGNASSVLTATGLSLHTGGKYLRLHGLDRILAAESNRPWLRGIAIQVGQHMRQMAATGRVSAFSSSALVSQAQQAYDQDRTSALKKKVKSRIKSYQEAYTTAKG